MHAVAVAITLNYRALRLHLARVILGASRQCIYCGGVQWTPLQDHLLRTVVDPLQCIDIRPAWQLAIELVKLLETTSQHDKKR
jgi:hypothetical protein